MKVIDEKGKIFGKLNVIDLIAVVLVIALAAIVVTKLTGVEDGTGLGNTTKLTYTVEVTNVDQEVCDYIQKNIPGQLMASGEMLDGYVVAADVTPSKDPVLDASLTANSQVALTASKENTYDIVFTIEANVKNAVTNELGTQEIRVGKTHIVKTTKFELDNGMILSLKTE